MHLLIDNYAYDPCVICKESRREGLYMVDCERNFIAPQTSRLVKTLLCSGCIADAVVALATADIPEVADVHDPVAV